MTRLSKNWTKEKQKEYNKEYCKKWYIKNRDKVITASKKSKESRTGKQKEKDLKKSYEWREDNKEKIREQRLLRYKTPSGRAKFIYANAKNRAKKIGMEFDLDRNDIISRMEKGICEATGVQLKFDEVRTFYTPSLDRINSSKGYTIDNVQVVCWGWNQLKNEFSIDDTWNFINEIARFKGTL